MAYLLVNECIQIKWEYRTRKYYEEKGYVFTKFKEYFTIKIKDLPINSDVTVNVVCDYCGKIIPKKYNKYNKQREDVEKDCCTNKECSNKKGEEVSLKLHGYTHYAKTEKAKTYNSDRQRFDFSIIQEEFKNRGYNLLTSEKDYKNNSTKLQFICPHHEEEGILEIDWCHFVADKNKGCKHCSDERRGWGFTVWEQQASKSSDFENYKLYKIKCYDENETFYKIGITYTSLDKRFTKRKLPYNFEVIEIIESDSAKYIWDLEKELHRKHKDAKLHYKYPLKQFGGYTECFTDLIN